MIHHYRNNGCHSRNAKLFPTTSVSDSAKCKRTKVNTHALIPKLTLSRRFCLELYHQPNGKLDGFRFRLGASRMSSHIEELWYNETVRLGMTIYIYIYIYMYIYETETLMSTLHHNIFTNFDYVFSATFILSDFNPYLLSYCPYGKTNTKYNLTRHLTWMIPNDLYI